MTIIGKAIVVETAKTKELKEAVVETAKATKEPTKAEIAAKLTELGIEFDEKSTKAQLLELLPKTEETEEE